MIIKLILSGGFLILLVYAIAQYRRSRLLSSIMMGVSVAGVFMAIFPETTNVVANWAGVGRGADLVLYCFALIALLAIFNLHLRLRATRETVTEVARAVALISGQAPESRATPGPAPTKPAPDRDEGGSERPGPTA